QLAAMEALRRNEDPIVTQNYATYGARRAACEKKLTEMGISFLKSPATFYVWCKVPTDEKSAAFCQRILSNTGVVVTPGTAFGSLGEGYFRIALTVPERRMIEALDRIAGQLG
ncbi:MAG: aminotransferase class I/II-fold pyridoxal phosphate-dependent enzyme, partial [Deltaproteobacteria bacterium]|nr:aminotransferase class I/II-fold pyridoxal phosphate-dependent enzyme [Deltaproteobacteria bacterium]